MAPSDLVVPETPYGFHLISLDTVQSTNDEAHRLARTGMPDKTCVWAYEQTTGRGRHGRKWYSPAGNLYCSILFHHADLRTYHTNQLSFIAALSVGKAIEAFLGPIDTYWFKWPNDILINTHKVAGILLENEVYNHISCTIVGIGVNIFSAPRTIDVTSPATALAWRTKHQITVKQILIRVLHHFAYWHDIWIKTGFTPVQHEWILHALGWGQRLIIHYENKDTVQGWFRTVGDDGALGLQPLDDHKTIQWIRRGEVHFPSMQEMEY